jgi:peptidoglycan/xylan/chitin deacetylase (PgdA/CDA1 family)
MIRPDRGPDRQPDLPEVVRPRVRLGSAGRLAVAVVMIAWLIGWTAVPTSGASVTVVSHGPRTQPVVALTFDDGIGAANCRRILAILVADRVPATFFPLAEAMELDPAFWHLVAGAGYPVGNHTLSHPQMPQLALAAQVHQIEAGRTLAESILGRPLLAVFRPPYGAYDSDTLTAASTAGYKTVLLWDTSDRDTSPKGHEPAMLAAGELGTNGSIVLLHCGPNATPYLLQPLIDSYRSRGFRFVTIPKLLGLPWSPGSTSAVTPSQILDGLSALPATSTGGPVTGPNGYVAPASSPTPSIQPTPTSQPTPTTQPAPSVQPTLTPSPQSSPASSAAGSSAVSLTQPGSAPGGATPPPGTPRPTDDAGSVAVALVGLTTLVAGAIVLLGVARRPRRRQSDRP